MSGLHWSAAYVGLLYEDAHCWELVRRVYQERYGIELADYDADLASVEEKAELVEFLDSVEGTHRCAELMLSNACAPTWLEVPLGEEREGDVALLWYTNPDYVTHCGVVLERGNMLHTRLKTSAITERYDGRSAWRRRLVRIVRHRDRA